jgi:anti-anti-sigma factor
MLNIKKENGTVKLEGRLDASQSEKAKEELSKINESITIDMSDLDYISSSGLSVLIKTYKRLEEGGETVTLTNMSDRIRDVFELTRLDQFFDIE